LVQAGIAAQRAEDLDGARVSYADLTRIIQQGTLADAEALAIKVGESAELRRIVDLTLQRLQLEAEIQSRARARRLEAEAEARASASRERELSARRDDAARRLGLRGRGSEILDATRARDELDRARAALDDMD